MEKYSTVSWPDIVSILKSDASKGLNEIDCNNLREKYGSNKVDIINKNNVLFYIILIFKQKLNYVYALIIGFLLFYRFYFYAEILGVIFVINIIAQMLHNILRQMKLSGLKKINSTKAIVLRDGVVKIIKSEELVVGDIVKFQQGTLIPADIRIIKASNLKVDERSITGEHFLKEKFEGKVSGYINSIKEMKNILFKGTVVKQGTGTGIVISTGNFTQLGKIITMITYANEKKHIFANKISNIWFKYIGMFTLIVMCIALLLIWSSIPIDIIAFSLFIIGCFPIVAFSALNYYMIIRKFKKDNIIINNFSVFDFVKDLDIMFLDKIGSVSKNEMEVKQIYTNDKIVFDGKSAYVRDTNFNRMLEISLICNNASYDEQHDGGKGNITEIAYLKFAAMKKVYKSAVDNSNSRIFEIPIDTDKRFYTVLTNNRKGYRANSRGNLDSLLSICTHVMIDGVERELTDERIKKIKDIDMKFSLDGLITQGIAYRNFKYKPSRSENIESNMVFVGIMALENPLIDTLEDSVESIKNKGIIPILFTEENKLSAITNGKRANIIKNPLQVISGIELDSLNKKELTDVLSKVRIFCKVTPDVKAKIISLFIKDGYKVASTGDTLGDIPSLNISTVGISRADSSEAVRKFSDFFIKGHNYLSAFFKVRNFSMALLSNIERAFMISATMIASELLTLFIGFFIGKQDIFNFINIIFLNILFLIPISIIMIEHKGKEISFTEMVIRSVIYSSGILTICSKTESGESVLISSIILSLGIFMFILFNSFYEFGKFSKEISVILIELVCIGLFCFIYLYFNSIMVSTFAISQACGFIFILLIFEILIKKWQNS
ncbi:cation-transporting P-type ATPase [Clostridium sp. BJN0001]|uniref:P-type ATPase n=1 Tax=Clostridium sp. BJN0001 TaxID=2930219 RepID=UPI001FD544A6|nr:cation-transporting P-type ATPase [Clostridium sp. BJN0001]